MGYSPGGCKESDAAERLTPGLSAPQGISAEGLRCFEIVFSTIMPSTFFPPIQLSPRPPTPPPAPVPGTVSGIRDSGVSKTDKALPCWRRETICK